MGSPVSYAAMLKSQLVHAPVSPSASEEKRRAEKEIRHDHVELQLVAAMMQIGKYVDLNPTGASPVEQNATLDSRIQSG
uniref:Uncharacterized protein n=1 Tax=Physcomitrium patens TaxID=3218 RepID=A0A2K1L1N6_PHYPA|nr:hypothetical protein PHYPA_002730 [Physcomitrium patens]